MREHFTITLLPEADTTQEEMEEGCLTLDLDSETAQMSVKEWGVMVRGAWSAGNNRFQVGTTMIPWHRIHSIEDVSESLADFGEEEFSKWANGWSLKADAIRALEKALK